MAGNFTTYGANAFLDGTPMPATLYVQLHTADPTVAGTTAVAVESTRKSFTRDAAAAGATQNAAVLEWLNAAATETITHVTIWDASTSGNCWWVAARVGGGLAVTATDTITIDTGDLDIAVTLWA